MIWIFNKAGTIHASYFVRVGSVMLLILYMVLHAPINNVSCSTEFEKPLILTAANNIHTVLTAHDGTLWAATTGGILHWKSIDTPPQIWTAVNGLPANDVLNIKLREKDGSVTAFTSGGACVIDSNGNVIQSSEPRPEITVSAECDGELYRATPFAFQHRRNDKWEEITLPDKSNGTHISALARGASLTSSTALARGASLTSSPALARGASFDGKTCLYTAIYGDGLYTYCNGQWSPINTPGECRNITSLAISENKLFMGTSANGVWYLSDNQWHQLSIPAALPSADIQALACNNGTLYASTFDKGLIKLENKNPEIISPDASASRSPRQLATLQNQLYIRQANGSLQRYDEKSVSTAFDKQHLPRPYVSSISADSSHLYIGSWAGWAVTDGEKWEYHYHDPELAGNVITAISVKGDEVWIGTQTHGLYRYKSGSYQKFQEPQGLTDDWVTCIAVYGDRLLVGTYTGGLLEYKNDRFGCILDTKHLAVRAIDFITLTHKAVAATPNGIYIESSESWKRIDPKLTGGSETQAIIALPGGLWIGSRSSLAYLPNNKIPM